jgi:hypothetical protein
LHSYNNNVWISLLWTIFLICMAWSTWCCITCMCLHGMMVAWHNTFHMHGMKHLVLHGYIHETAWHKHNCMAINKNALHDMWFMTWSTRC